MSVHESTRSTRVNLHQPKPQTFGGKIKSCAIKALDFIAPVNPVSKKRKIRLVSTGIEKTLGSANYNRLAPQYKVISKDSATGNRDKYYRIVNNVFTKLVKQCECQDKFEYEVRLLEDQTINAYCLPGGKTVITVGILDKINTLVQGDEKKLESAVAFIMGHELTHANASHGIFSMMFTLTAGAVGFIAGTIIGHIVANKAKDGEKRNRNINEKAEEIGRVAAKIFTFVAKMVTYLIERVLSRLREYEADRHSLTYLKNAGYDFEGAQITMDMFQQMRGKPGKFKQFIESVFSTHPAPRKRLEAINKEIKRLA